MDENDPDDPIHETFYITTLCQVCGDLTPECKEEDARKEHCGKPVGVKFTRYITLEADGSYIESKAEAGGFVHSRHNPQS